MIEYKLEKILDYRTGDKKIHLVIPTKSENERIKTLAEYYSEIVDIVILDDSPTENFIELCQKHRLTLFKRLVSIEAPEVYATVYAKEYCEKNAVIFWFFADEYINKSDLKKISDEMNICNALRVQRVDYLFADCWDQSQSGKDYRVFKCDCISWNGAVHGSLKPINTKDVSSFVPKVFHLHPIRIQSYYGTPGKYAYKEFENVKIGFWIYARWLRRFIIPAIKGMIKVIINPKLWTLKVLVYLAVPRAIYALCGLVVIVQLQKRTKCWQELFQKCVVNDQTNKWNNDIKSIR